MPSWKDATKKTSLISARLGLRQPLEIASAVLSRTNAGQVKVANRQHPLERSSTAEARSNCELPNQFVTFTSKPVDLELNPGMVEREPIVVLSQLPEVPRHAVSNQRLFCLSQVAHATCRSVRMRARASRS